MTIRPFDIMDATKLLVGGLLPPITMEVAPEEEQP
jgi:hypothetical protein